MEISSSYYRSQSITSLLKDTVSSAPIEDSGQRANKSSSGSSLSGISYSQGYTAFQQSLAASNLSGSASTSNSAQTNVEGLTLDEVKARGRVINPADWLSQSDVDLFHKVTGGTIKDGVIYDSAGNEDTSNRSLDLVGNLYQMRDHGTFDGNGNRVGISGSITADDLQQYIDHFSKGGWVGTDLGVLDDAMKALTSEQA